MNPTVSNYRKDIKKQYVRTTQKDKENKTRNS